MKTIRIGMIGAGYWGEKLLRVFGQLPDIELRAVCDSDASRLQSLGVGIGTVADADALVARDDLDAILVVTPPSTHFALARKVLLAGKHCWVEKPLAMQAVQARELVQLAESRNRVLFVDETFLYDPLVTTAKSWIDSGRLGTLYHLSFERLGQGRIRTDSNVWWNSAPHDLSILCHLAGGEIEDVNVQGFAYVQPGVADYAAGTVRLRGGVSAHIYLSWLSPLKVASIVATGSRGMLHYEGRFGKRSLSFFDYAIADPAATAGNVVPFERFAPTETVQGGTEEPLGLAAEAFLGSIRHGIQAPSAGRFSQRVVELLERAAVVS